MKKVVSFSLYCKNTPSLSLPDWSIRICPETKYKYYWNRVTKQYMYVFQTKNMYCNGAIRNLEIKKKQGIYNDWTFRYYINNTVPKSVVDKLKSFGAEIVDMSESRIPGMFWRFLPFEDNSVDIFIVRDSDSRINKRGEIAVNEWLTSNKQLHVMRDHPHHKFKISGGMWGYNSSLKRFSIKIMMNDFLKRRNYSFKKMDDMLFLDNIYDIFFRTNQTCEHDQYFKYKYSCPFPKMNINTKQYYHFVGEIFDEHDGNPFRNRDSKIIKNANI